MEFLSSLKNMLSVPTKVCGEKKGGGSAFILSFIEVSKFLAVWLTVISRFIVRCISFLEKEAVEIFILSFYIVGLCKNSLSNERVPIYCKLVSASANTFDAAQLLFLQKLRQRYVVGGFYM